jgi:hypothetical protein
MHWQEIAINRPLIDDLSNKEDLENEANWIEKRLLTRLIYTLNHYV